MTPIRLRLTYSKTGLIRFISHRDLLRLFFRAFSRTGFPITYSEGYSPHPRATFCPPLKVGMEGLNELLEITVSRPVEEEPACTILNESLPEGITVKTGRIVSPGTPTLGKTIKKAEYRVIIHDPVLVTSGAVAAFLSADDVPVTYRQGPETKTVNARRGVEEIELEGEGTTLRLLLSVEENGRPYEVLSALSGAEGGYLPALRWQRVKFFGPGLD